LSTVIRVLGLAEIETLLDWAATEGWNPGLDDARAFQAADPAGFIGAFEGETLVAGISVVAYDATFGFLGLYICHPDHRGRGLGRAVWNAGMAHLGERTIGLDGVPAQQPNYRRMGFSAHYDTLRMTGVLEHAPAQSSIIAPLVDISQLQALEQVCFPAERAAFLAAWIAPPHRTMVATRNGHVCGYMVVRRCRSGQKIGPLFAEDMGVALDLIGSVAGSASIDVPAPQTKTLASLAQKGLTSQFRTARMYRGPAPAMDLSKVFGVTTLELG